MSQGYQSPFENQQQPRRSSGMSWLLGLVLVLLGFLTLGGVVCVAGVWYVATNVEGWLVSLGREAIVAGINDSDLPQAEKDEVIAQVDRVANAYKEKKINQQDLEKFMTELQDAPAMQALALYGIDEIYLSEANLPPAELAAARRTFQRAIRGVLEGKISQDTLLASFPQEDELMQLAQNADGNLKPEDVRLVGNAPGDDVNTEDLREMLVKLKVACDNAGIPDEDYQPDIGDEVKKLVDRLLEGK
jgi:hypothetical protein